MSDPNLPPVDAPPPAPQRARGEWLKVALGFVVGLVVSTALFGLLSMFVYSMSTGVFAMRRGPDPLIIQSVIQVLILIPLTIWGFRMWRRKRPGGALSGAVLGCCVGALLIGTCSGVMVGVGLFSPK